MKIFGFDKTTGCYSGNAADVDYLGSFPTPYYLYDMNMLEATLESLETAIGERPFKVHYAIKANSNPQILKAVAAHGFGADCVSGGEISLALEAGFNPAEISYAGVGKTDDEIRLGLEKNIGCFNIESIEEIGIIGGIAASMGVTAPVALRVNPDVDAHTHHHITTGLAENKFGIDMRLLDKAVAALGSQKSLNLVGLHFHIGSQIKTTEPFVRLCDKINILVADLAAKGHELKTIDVGGGFAVDYADPDAHPVPDFAQYVDAIFSRLNLAPGLSVVIEPGRSLVCQCGSLISRVIYVKEGVGKRFVILDAGMNDLIRPALYGASHKIENLSASSGADVETYDVVGPVCESSDTFAADLPLPTTRRGDLFAIRSAGAYGEAMSSRYNYRRPAAAVCIPQA